MAIVIKDFQVSFKDAYGNEIMGKDELLDLTECDRVAVVATQLVNSQGFYKSCIMVQAMAEKAEDRFHEIIAMNILEEIRNQHFNFCGYDCCNSIGSSWEALHHAFIASGLNF